MQNDSLEKKSLDIWEDVLKKTVKSNLLTKASTVPQKEEAYDVQIFELLVAESLNLRDRHTRWEVTRASHDSGVDLLGTDISLYTTPFTTTQYRLLSIGQVKRSKRSYRYEDFRTDIRKARGYWINSDLFHGNSPKQFLFILSTEGKNGVKVLRNHLEKDLVRNTDIQLKNDQLAHVQLIDAAYIIKSWKLDLGYYEGILEDALTSEQLTCFHEYVSELDCSWLSVSIQAPESGGIGEPITYSLFIESPLNELTLTLYAKWIPPEQGNIQLLHPLRMINPHVLGTTIHVRERAEIQIMLRSMHPGQCDFGRVELYSSERVLIASAPLKSLNICEGFCPVYFELPNRNILYHLKEIVYDRSPAFIPISISGCGGIGKSSLVSEVMVTAAAEGYFPCDLVQPKDLLHPRLLLQRLFTELVRPYIPQNTFLPDIPLQIERYLGSNYRTEWETAIHSFFDGTDQEINIEFLAECLVSLILVASHEGPIFLWMSNMHWASKETFNILHIVVDELESNQELLGNRVLWIFEGRSGEVLSYDQQAYYPVDWERFLTNNLVQPYLLSAWVLEDCRSFLHQLFIEPEGNGRLYAQYCDQLLKYACGNPMLILELVRSQLEHDILQLDTEHGSRLKINRFSLGDARWSDSVADTIDRRIHFYREKCSDFIDFCVILAALDDSIPSLLSEQLMKRLHTECVGIDALVFQSNFLVREAQEYHFFHEHYLTSFRLQQLRNKDLLIECLTYYKRLSSQTPRDQYAEIKLRLLDDNADLANLRRKIISILRDNIPQNIEQSLYKLLLQLPLLKENGDISQSMALFQLCESYVRAGSWKSGQECLEQLLALPIDNNAEELLIHVKAYQELSNILADRLLFEQAIQKAEEGLELTEMSLFCPTTKLSDVQCISLHVQREKLLARLAVCHWFAGNPAQGLTIQKKCYELAVSRGDEYSAGHVLYEIGTLLLHFNIDIGIEIMEIVLAQCEAIPVLEQYERTLIETQLLIGKLMYAVKQQDYTALQHIRLECRRLLELGRNSPHSYERFLCLTIRGICNFLLEKDKKKAQDSFYESLRCAIESDMPNLEWKAMFHIAQLCVLEGNAESEIFIKEAKRQVENALAINPCMERDLTKMFQPVIEHLNLLSSRKELCNAYPDTTTLISVSAEGCLFVIMN